MAFKRSAVRSRLAPPRKFRELQVLPAIPYFYCGGKKGTDGHFLAPLRLIPPKSQGGGGLGQEDSGQAGYSDRCRSMFYG